MLTAAFFLAVVLVIGVVGCGLWIVGCGSGFGFACGPVAMAVVVAAAAAVVVVLVVVVVVVVVVVDSCVTDPTLFALSGHENPGPANKIGLGGAGGGGVGGQ